jgi:hypothetical protein
LNPRWVAATAQERRHLPIWRSIPDHRLRGAIVVSCRTRRVADGRLGDLRLLPYSHAASLFDVTMSSNGPCHRNPYLCTAGLGYDGPHWGDVRVSSGTIAGKFSVEDGCRARTFGRPVPNRPPSHSMVAAYASFHVR